MPSKIPPCRKQAPSADHHPIVVHTFAQKYHFKGSWDATSKTLKQRILNNELKYERCKNAFECYKQLSLDLIKDGKEQKISKLLAYKKANDTHVLQNTNLTTKCTHIGFSTKYKAK